MTSYQTWIWYSHWTPHQQKEHRNITKIKWSAGWDRLRFILKIRFHFLASGTIWSLLASSKAHLQIAGSFRVSLPWRRIANVLAKLYIMVLGNHTISKEFTDIISGPIRNGYPSILMINFPWSTSILTPRITSAPGLPTGLSMVPGGCPSSRKLTPNLTETMIDSLGAQALKVWGNFQTNQFSSFSIKITSESKSKCINFSVIYQRKTSQWSSHAVIHAKRATPHLTDL